MLASTQTLHSIHPVRNNINMHELTKLSNGGYRISPNIMSSIMVLDIIFRHHPLNTFVSVGQSFFVDSQDSAPLPGCLIARQGFYQSVRPASNQLILNVDTSATAFYSHGPMTDLACRILNCRHPNELPCSIPSCGHDKLDTFIKNVKFIVTHHQDRPQYRASKLTKTDAQKLRLHTVTVYVKAWQSISPSSTKCIHVSLTYHVLRLGRVCTPLEV
jgi:hypothetical protein